MLLDTPATNGDGDGDRVTSIRDSIAYAFGGIKDAVKIFVLPRTLRHLQRIANDSRAPCSSRTEPDQRASAMAEERAAAIARTTTQVRPLPTLEQRCL
jgi:hypothetical protein